MENCCALSMVQEPIRRNKSKAHVSWASKTAVREATVWTDCIKGNGKKPKSNFALPGSSTEVRCARVGPHTLISDNHSEPARNKPVVAGRCSGEKVNLFLDTGAEMNVVDSGYVRELMKKQLPIVYNPAPFTIQFTNGNKMFATGFPSLRLQIGGVTALQKFRVVEKVFPKIIVGIRTMKTMNIVVDPTADCVYVGNGQKVPFVSTIAPESVAPSVQTGNALKTH